jgi:hypothetical protein
MKRLLRKILLSLFAVLWTVLASEAYLRCFSPVAILPRFIEAGDHGIRRNIAGERYQHSSAEYRVDFSINEQGIRDPRVFKVKKPKDVLRVLILGDSFAMGYGVSYEDSVPAHLESLLSGYLDGPVEVINLGVSGFGTAESLIALEADGWAFEPDIVMSYWHGSDLQDNVRSQLYELSAAGLVRKNRTYLPAVALRTWLFSFPAYRWVAEHSHLYGWLRGEGGRISREMLFLYNSMRANGTAETEVDPDVISSKVRLSLTLLHRMQSACVTRGVPFFVADIPSNIAPGVYRSTFPREAMTELGFSFDIIDPMPSFIKARSSADEPLIYWQHSAGHWTPLGSSLMADSVFERIQQDAVNQVPE